MPSPGDRHEGNTAKQRASALFLNLSAVAAGVWEPTPPLLDALADLASATAWDLCLVDMLVLA
jgi:hypothetical protein